MDCRMISVVLLMFSFLGLNMHCKAQTLEERSIALQVQESVFQDIRIAGGKAKFTNEWVMSAVEELKSKRYSNLGPEEIKRFTSLGTRFFNKAQSVTLRKEIADLILRDFDNLNPLWQKNVFRKVSKRPGIQDELYFYDLKNVLKSHLTTDTLVSKNTELPLYAGYLGEEFRPVLLDLVTPLLGINKNSLAKSDRGIRENSLMALARLGEEWAYDSLGFRFIVPIKYGDVEDFDIGNMLEKLAYIRTERAFELLSLYLIHDIRLVDPWNYRIDTFGPIALWYFMKYVEDFPLKMSVREEESSTFIKLYRYQDQLDKPREWVLEHYRKWKLIQIKY